MNLLKNERDMKIGSMDYDLYTMIYDWRTGEK